MARSADAACLWGASVGRQKSLPFRERREGESVRRIELAVVNMVPWAEHERILADLAQGTETV